MLETPLGGPRRRCEDNIKVGLGTMCMKIDTE